MLQRSNGGSASGCNYWKVSNLFSREIIIATVCSTVQFRHFEGDHRTIHGDMCVLRSPRLDASQEIIAFPPARFRSPAE